MIKTIAITGASGFIGRQLVRLFRGRKHLICITRDVDKAAFNHEDIEVRGVNWESKDSIRNAIKGADAIIHGAAVHPERSTRNQNKILDFNVGGTKRLLECIESLDRFIFISSMRSLVNGRYKNKQFDESSEYDFKKYDSAYGYSKHLSEQICFDFYKKNSLPLIVVNPAPVIGANDIGPSPNGLFVRSFISSKIVFSVKTNYSFVDVTDVSRAIELLVDNGRLGERYILCSANWPMEKFIKTIHKIAKIKKPIIFLPLPLAHLSAIGFELAESLIPSIKIPLTRSSVYYAKLNPSYDGSKICNFDFNYKDPNLTLEETVGWLQNKYPV